MNRGFFFLRTFGGLTLERVESSTGAVPRQKKRLALLALLAASGERGLSREKLLGYLWPESDSDQGRNSLSQILYGIRRELGADALLGNGDIRLNPKVVEADVQVFQKALAEARLREAVSSYGGPFLDGFYLRELPEFERWVEDQRERMALQYGQALERLAREASQKNLLAEAAEWWRLRSASDPLSARIARSYAEALAATGDRTAAIKHLDSHIEQVRSELGVEPDPAVLSLLTALRVPANGDRTSRAPAQPSQADTAAHTATPMIASPSSSHAETLRSSSDEAVVKQRYRFLGASVLLVFALGTLFWLAPHQQNKPNAADTRWSNINLPARVVVFPFRAAGPPIDANIGYGASVLLQQNLDAADKLSVYQARLIKSRVTDIPALKEAQRLARDQGADFFIVGDTEQNADSTIEIAAQLYSTRSALTPHATASATGKSVHLIGLVDSLTRKILLARAALQPGKLTEAAAHSTESLPAFKAYIEGETEFRAGRYGRALAAFERATMIDPRFALAYYRHGVVADWVSMGARAEDAERASALADRLPERERMIVQANLAWQQGDIANAENILRRTLELFPNDTEAAYLLGEVIFHSGGYVGQSPREALPYFATVTRLEPDNVEALAHRARVEVQLARLAIADSLAQRVRALRPAGDRLAAELEEMLAVTRGETSARIPAGARAADRDALLYVGAWRVAAYTGQFQAGANYARALLASTTDDGLRIQSHFRLAEHLTATRDMKGALEALNDSRLGAGWSIPARAFFVSLPVSEASKPVLSAYLDSLRNWSPTIRPAALSPDDAAANGITTELKSYPIALLALGLGDTVTAAHAANDLMRVNSSAKIRDLAMALSHGLRAEISWKAGKYDAALLEFDSAVARVPLRYRLNLYGGLSLQRFRKAELLRELGRSAEARRWYETLVGGDSSGDMAFRFAAANRLKQLSGSSAVAQQ